MLLPLKVRVAAGGSFRLSDPEYAASSAQLTASRAFQLVLSYGRLSTAQGQYRVAYPSRMGEAEPLGATVPVLRPTTNGTSRFGCELNLLESRETNGCHYVRKLSMLNSDVCKVFINQNKVLSRAEP